MGKQKVLWEIKQAAMDGRYGDVEFIPVQGKKSGIKKMKVLAKKTPDRSLELICYAEDGDLLESNNDETEAHAYYSGDTGRWDFSVY